MHPSTDMIIVLIPLDFDYKKFLSISESTGISINIKVVEEMFEHLKIHNYVKAIDFEDENNNAYYFVTDFLKEMGFVIYHWDGESIWDEEVIINIGPKLPEKKDLIIKYLKEK